MIKKVNVREIIVDMLMQITTGEEKSHILIRQVLQKYNYMEECDKAFLKRVTEGTLERLISIDYILNEISSVKVNKMKPLIRNLMRMSVYQIMYMDKVPDSAACNEAVKIAGKRGFHNLKGFVNGVLRNVARNKDQIKFPSREENLLLALSVEYSMPEALVQLLLDQYGKKKTERILQGYLLEKPLTIRVRENMDETKREAMLKHFEKHHVHVQQHPYLPYAYAVKGIGDMTRDPFFEDGSYTVQDVSSMFVCELADIKEGDKILDVCAAPGGKSLHACEKLKGTGSVEARDLSDYKASFILENKERMKAEHLSVKVWDATEYDPASKEQYDLVLLDLPCSGLGVIGKKPEIKYRWQEASLKELDQLQKQIVDTVWDYVKPGGTLMYSTCTIRERENERVVSYITNNYPFDLQPLDDKLPKVLQDTDTAKGYITLLPGELSDGFFIAKMVRKS